jgi:hypothetical protein
MIGRRKFISLVEMCFLVRPREVLRLHQMIASSGSEWAQQTAAAFAEAAARESDSSAFEGVPASPDLECLRACVDYLARRNA